MKKGIYGIITAALAVILLFGAAGCGKKDADKITLSFDNPSAYFASEKKLTPVAGDYPADGDVFESARIILNAEPTSKIRLAVEFEDGVAGIEGLKIAVGGQILDFENGLILYDSSEAVSKVELDIKIFLDKNTPSAAKGKTISFYFVLSAY
jgi:hypothetical protein